MPVSSSPIPRAASARVTLATNIAGYFASEGHAVMLGDADRQQSSRLWLGLRPAAAARPISSWEVDAEPHRASRPRAPRMWCWTRRPACTASGSTRCCSIADKVIVPLQPSVFDIYATRAFLDELARAPHGRADAGGHRRHAGATRAPSPPTSCTSSVDSLGRAGAGLPARHAELRAAGRARPDAVRRGAQPRRTRPGAVDGICRWLDQ